VVHLPHAAFRDGRRLAVDLDGGLNRWGSARCTAAVAQPGGFFRQCQNGAAWLGWLTDDDLFGAYFGPSKETPTFGLLLCQSHVRATTFALPRQAYPDWATGFRRVHARPQETGGRTTAPPTNWANSDERVDIVTGIMLAGQHVIHRGSYRSGQDAVWAAAMARIAPLFDPAAPCPYHVRGADYPLSRVSREPLIAYDFIGRREPNGLRQWRDGALLRAMRLGKRLRIDQVERLPATVLKVLLAVRDLGRLDLATLEDDQGQPLPTALGKGTLPAALGFAMDVFVDRDETDPAILETQDFFVRHFPYVISYGRKVTVARQGGASATSS
jgi:hypothetical protein